jgi:hypothetical protein
MSEGRVALSLCITPWQMALNVVAYGKGSRLDTIA